jgi:lincosamide nucleotidyltransferase A/C/D/E
MTAMLTDDVAEMIRRWRAEGITVWLDGGWGVDALLGEESRPHHDLDVVLEHHVLEQFAGSMNTQGFHRISDGGSFNHVFRDPSGRQVDVRLVDTSRRQRTTAGIEVYAGEGLPFEVGALDGRGTVGGEPVGCCTADYQVRSRLGGFLEELNDNARRDVLALHRRLRIPLPAGYTDVVITPTE